MKTKLQQLFFGCILLSILSCTTNEKGREVAKTVPVIEPIKKHIVTPSEVQSDRLVSCQDDIVG